MNVALKKLGIVIRDLLSINEQTIRIGRDNFVRDDFTSLQIVIDAVGQGIRLNSSSSFDGTAELITYAQQYRLPATIDFYGDGAYALANKFALLIQSQAGYELQRDGGLSVFEVSSITDVKLLTGEQYSERYQLALNLQYTISETVSALRIDEMQLTTIGDLN